VKQNRPRRELAGRVLRLVEIAPVRSQQSGVRGGALLTYGRPGFQPGQALL
jgi:hypothetical protein